MNEDSRGQSQPGELDFILPDPKDIWSAFIKHFNWFFGLVVGALLIGFITMLLMVTQLIIEAYRFNSTFYRESNQLQIQQEFIQNSVEQQRLMNDAIIQIKTDIETLKQE